MNIIRLEQCESTHQYMHEKHTDLPPWTVVTAEYQTGGHGRHNRKWLSPKGKNLCFNLLLPTENLKPELYATVTQIAAITLASILREKNINAAVKWPNDILVNKIKICGIISELLLPFISVGIGLNVNTERDDFEGLCRGDPRGRPLNENMVLATSMFIETGKFWDRDAILQEFLGKFEKNFGVLRESGLEPFIEEWRKMGNFVGQKGRVVEGNSVLEGVIEGIQSDGSLLFRVKDELKTIWSGDLEI